MKKEEICADIFITGAPFSFFLLWPEISWSMARVPAIDLTLEIIFQLRRERDSRGPKIIINFRFSKKANSIETEILSAQKKRNGIVEQIQRKNMFDTIMEIAYGLIVIVGLAANLLVLIIYMIDKRLRSGLKQKEITIFIRNFLDKFPY